jgi:hypothetical protein
MRLRLIALAGVLAVLMLGTVLSSCRSQPLGAAAGGLALFQKPTFTFIYPETRPQFNEATTELALQAAPGEIEPVSFGVLPQRQVRNATIQVSDLNGPDGAVIPASAVDARVAQVWKQRAPRGKDSETITVPEALLKDDALDFLDPRWTESNLPSCPPDAPVRTDFLPDQAKQVFLIVTVPADAKPGDYTGEVRAGETANPARLKLTLTVLPFQLRGPGYKICMYYNDNIGAEVPLSVYRARLAYMRAMGINGLRLKANRDTLDEEIREVKAAGFEGPIMLLDTAAYFGPQGLKNMAFYVDTLKGAGYDPYIYGVDEPNVADTGPREGHSLNGQIAVYERIKQVGGLATTALSVITDRVLTDQYNQMLDFAQYSLHTVPDLGFKDYVRSLDASPEARRHPFEGYYFTTAFENPRRNRLLGGFYLPNSHMAAVNFWTFYSYHQKGVPGIYDDFALPDGNKKRWMMVFPTREGCLPTLQSEALREGVDDLRYLNTFLEMAREKEQQSAPAAVDGLRRQVMGEVARYRDYGQTKPEDQTANQYTDAQFDQSRKVIVQAILKLQAIKPGG